MAAMMRPLTLLIAEDDEQQTEILRISLINKGYDVFIASSGIEALRLLQEEKIKVDLLITDLNLPQMSGMELAHQLLQILPELPILLFTGEMIETPLPPNVKALVQKPYRISHLLSVIKEILSPDDD